MVNYSSVLSELRGYDENALLLAVSKFHPYEAILEAYNEGARFFGENRVQETEKKFPPLEERPEGMKVYLIGQLQSNKVKKAVRLFDRIESVDSIKLLKLIDKEAENAGRVIDILLEFNSSGDENKSGFESEEEVLEAAKLSIELKNVNLIGLMTIGPLGMDENRNREAFEKTQKLYERMKQILPVTVLSMGMSQDYKTALLYGSNEVRIGTAIFGERS